MSRDELQHDSYFWDAQRSHVSRKNLAVQETMPVIPTDVRRRKIFLKEEYKQKKADL